MTELGRVVRGRFLAMKNDDFVIAARLDGASESRIIFRHMLPSLTSHIIASLTLAILLMILAETGLSFLGLAYTARYLVGGSTERSPECYLNQSGPLAIYTRRFCSTCSAII